MWSRGVGKPLCFFFVDIFGTYSGHIRDIGTRCPYESKPLRLLLGIIEIQHNKKKKGNKLWEVEQAVAHLVEVVV